jgi:hypothetical protein
MRVPVLLAALWTAAFLPLAAQAPLPVGPAASPTPTPPAPRAAEPSARAVHSGRARDLKVRPPRLDADIRVDGVLDEEAWQQAALLTSFTRYFPNDGAEAVDSTEVLVWYSATALHLGLRAFEPHGDVRATLADRDRLTQDDRFEVLLGTLNDGRQALVFEVNPFGIQADGSVVETGRTERAGREAPDLSQDFVWQSKGRLTDTGYEVELRIPFKSIRYQSGDVQDWTFNVVRVIQHSGYEDSWAPASRSNATFIGQSGALLGLTDMKRGLVVDLNPTLTQRAPGARAPIGAGWSYGFSNPDVGGNLRWGVTNNLTANATVNPDFSQVEADQGQVVYDPRQALFFAERRPFFLDGIELFNTPNQLVYTRRIVQPEAAVKLTGTALGFNVGLLSAVDDEVGSRSGTDNPIYNILRLQRDIGQSSRIGVLYTDKMDGDDYNRLASLDARLVFAKTWALQAQLAGSVTRRDGASVTAPLWDVQLNRQARNWRARNSFKGISRDFGAQAGFIGRAGIVQAISNNTYSFYGKPGALIETYTPGIRLDGLWQYERFTDGRPWQDWKIHLTQAARLRGGWNVGLSAFIESFGYDSLLYRNYFTEQPGGSGGLDTLPYAGTPRLPNFDLYLQLGTPEFSHFSFAGTFIYGQDENFFEWSSATIGVMDVGMTVRPTDQLRLNFTYVGQHYWRKTDGTRVAVSHIPRLKVEYQASRFAFVRLVSQYVFEDVDDLRDDSRTEAPILIRSGGTFRRAVARRDKALRTDLLFSLQPNPGTVFFLGYGQSLESPDALRDPVMRRTNDAFFTKLSYLFRL